MEELYRVLAIDYGERRVGLALSDSSRMLASPLSVLPNPGWKQLISQLQSIIHEHEVRKVVIGIPWGLEGQETKKTTEVKEFAARLAADLPIPVIFQDESFTTVDALEALRSRGYDAKKSRYLVDAVAASLILRRYLEETEKHES